MVHLPNFPDRSLSCNSQAVLAEKIGLPHVFALREMLRDLDLAEVLDALLQLLFHTHLLLGWPFLGATRVP